VDGLELRARATAPIPLDAQLEVGAGELVALLGPSGSGKSTLLRTVAGLYRPSEARVACNGEVWLDSAAGIAWPPQRRHVGLVFQSYALFPHLSALDNVAAALGHLPRAERPARARKLLALVHLEGLEARRPAQLSGGQQQRVAVARALAREPAVLLLDEPFSAVDQMTRQRLQRELAALRRDLRVPILLVTHDLNEAAGLADRICILHRGRTLQAGPPGEVMQRPVSGEVARLVGLRNLYRGRILGHEPPQGAGDAGRTWLAWGDLRVEAPHRPELEVGGEVAWVVPSDHVVLHRRERPSRGEHENPVPGTVVELLVLGETMQLGLQPIAQPQALIAFGVPTHVGRRNGLAVGVPATVSLLAQGIHLIPAQAGSG
jgi:molybdate transport system ATP-binding protein